MSNKITGERAEDAAALWLRLRGYTILERNWRSKHWEIDIIASKGEKLHIIEVKSRSTVVFGYPEAAINSKKLLSLKNGVEEYLNLFPKWKEMQIDVLTVVWQNGVAEDFLMIEDVY